METPQSCLDRLKVNNMKAVSFTLVNEHISTIFINLS